MLNKKILSYIIGVAIGDGNLSNPNGRAIRLRITCDCKYQRNIRKIMSLIGKLLPKNKVSIVKRKDNCVDISSFSNKWGNWLGDLGWKVGKGSKIKQNISIPLWIKNNKKYSIECLRGLFETDGSIYLDRRYRMVNFTTAIFRLAKDVFSIIKKLGSKPHLYIAKPRPQDFQRKIKYTIRISKEVDKFIKLIGLNKN
jgi:DNA-binding transcriptional regulator WhiA